jgi:Na+/H+-dicarboxylate symporter
VKLPVDMQAIIIGVDRVLDMCRTSVNVWSDSCGCAVIARLETKGDKHPASIDDAEMKLEI